MAYVFMFSTTDFLNAIFFLADIQKVRLPSLLFTSPVSKMDKVELSAAWQTVVRLFKLR